MKATRTAVAAALVLFLAASCDTGIGYQTVQQETSQASTSVFTHAAVKDVVYFDGRFYAPLVGIYTRPETSLPGKDWDTVPFPGFGDSDTDYSTWGLAASSTRLYAALQKGKVSSTTRAVYTLDAGSTSWTAHAYSFGALSSSAARIVALYSVNNEIFAVIGTGTDTAYTAFGLWHLNAGSDSFEDTGISTTGFIYEGAYVSGSYCFAAKATSAATVSTLYRMTITAGAGITAGPASVPAPAIVTSMTAVAGTALALGCADGYVYLVDTAGTSLATKSLATAGSSNPVTALLAVPAGSSTVLLAGSYMTTSDSSAGYKEAVVTASSLSAFVTGSGTGAVIGKVLYDSTVKAVPVVHFALSGDGSRLFVCTASAGVNYSGLWSNAYDGSTWGGWVSE